MYKFKSANDRDMDALQNNKLWVSTLAIMNDPMDLGFYIKNRKYTPEDIMNFQNALNRSFVVISLTTEFVNRRLWNYYTEGMKGFVLAYRNEDLVNALLNAGATNIKTGKVLYVDAKQDLSDMIEKFIDSGTLPAVKNASLLFSKDKSWEAEHEYRIITGSAFLPRDGSTEPIGMCIDDVVPYQIGIGYKMEKETQDKVEKYAEEHGIEVRQYTPDFRDKRSNAFTNEIIVEGSKTKSKRAAKSSTTVSTSDDEREEETGISPEERRQWEELLDDVVAQE